MQITLKWDITAIDISDPNSMAKTTLKAGTHKFRRIKNPLGLKDDWLVTEQKIGFPEFLCDLIGREAFVIEEKGNGRADNPKRTNQSLQSHDGSSGQKRKTASRNI